MKPNRKHPWRKWTGDPNKITPAIPVEVAPKTEHSQSVDEFVKWQKECK